MKTALKNHPAVNLVREASRSPDDLMYEVVLHRGYHFAGLDNMPDTTNPDNPNLHRVGVFRNSAEFEGAGQPSMLLSYTTLVDIALFSRMLDIARHWKPRTAHGPYYTVQALLNIVAPVKSAQMGPRDWEIMVTKFTHYVEAEAVWDNVKCPIKVVGLNQFKTIKPS